MERAKSFFLTPSSPINLAIFRIVVFSGLAFAASSNRLLEFLNLSPEMIDPVPWNQWLVALLPSTQLVPWLVILFKSLCFCAAIGFFTRSSAILATLLGVYLIGIPHLYGKVLHRYQLLIWFGFLLAASPSGDSLSVDSLIKKGRKAFLSTIDVFSSKYTVPVRFAWLLFGVVYFFPGFNKLFVGGYEWIFSDNMKNLILYRSYKNAVPFFWIFDLPYASPIIAFGVVLFELGFVFALFNRWTRPIFVTIGFLFHAIVNLFIGFAFLELRACYVVFVDWYKLLPNFKSRSRTIDEPKPTELRLIFAVGSALIVFNCYFGFRNEWSWPFTAYPAMEMVHHPNDRLPRFKIVAFDGNGTALETEKEFLTLVAKMDVVRWVNRKKVHLIPPDSAARERELRLLWTELTKINPGLNSAKKVHLTMVVDPSAPPEIIAELKP